MGKVIEKERRRGEREEGKGRERREGEGGERGREREDEEGRVCACERESIPLNSWTRHS